MSDLILITGGFGYLGGRIALRVRADLQLPVRLGSRRKLAPPAWLPEADVAVVDMLEAATFDQALRGVKAVVHLAALNDEECEADRDKALRVNTLGTRSLLEAAVRAGVERFIYLSTAHVYGAPLTGHITENSPTHTVRPYAMTHLAAEEFVLAAHHNKSIIGTVLRLSNGFGFPVHPGVNTWMLLINDLCMQAVRDRQLVLRSSGSQLRNFIPLHDVGRVVCHFIRLPREGSGDGLFNVGAEQAIPVWAMAQRVRSCCQDVLGFEPGIQRPQPLAAETVAVLDYDISKLKRTGFVFEGNIDDEICQTLRMCALKLKGQKE
ncbi:MAG: SDR family oxidoreductase [Candidatus Omnitrophica bacterium]|nr:SDR family oxidoreductase [Candidatus Omnitrophota bacterium]